MPRRILIPLIVAAALFMEILDATVIAISLPQIAQSFGEDPVRLSLTITAYLLSLAVFLPVSGFIADRYGARTVFSIAIVIFTVSSIFCGLSQNLPQLFLARIAQGLGGSLMVPVGRLLILRTVEKRDLVSAMAYFTVPALVAPIIGPPLGGFITTYAHWRWIFFINVPIGLIGIALVLAFIPNLREPVQPRLDLKGWALAGLALAALLFGFENLGHSAFPLAAVLGILAVGLAASFLYLRHARSHPNPVLDLSLFRIETFHASLVGGFFFRIGLGSSQLLMPLMMQLGFGLSAFTAGLITLSFAVGAMVAKFVAEGLLRRLGFRKILIWNTYISAFFFAVFLLVGPSTPIAAIALLIFVSGAFRSLQFTALNTISFADIEPSRMSQSATLSAVFQQFSIAVGVAAGALLLHAFAARHGGALPVLDDFKYAFAALALVTMVSALFFTALPEKAGSAVSGYGLDQR